MRISELDQHIVRYKRNFCLNYYEKAWTGANTISNIQNIKSYLSSLIKIYVVRI